MKVTVRYFAAAREATGRTSETLEAVDGTTIDALVRDLVRRHPALREPAASLRYALGESFVPADTPLEDGAEVALIPPVGGG